ncbi:hypothetical protein J6T66_00005 [bacterium]|nr:hypothetical protein [bacterium]
MSQIENPIVYYNVDNFILRICIQMNFRICYGKSVLDCNPTWIEISPIAEEFLDRV